MRREDTQPVFAATSGVGVDPGLANPAAGALDEVRAITHALRPPELDRLGLKRALEHAVTVGARTIHCMCGAPADNERHAARETFLENMALGGARAKSCGVTLVIEGVFRAIYGVSGLPYDTPQLLQGATDLGFMMLPNYRAWVVVASLAVCFATWFMIEKTKLGAYLRAGTENPKLVEAFGVNVPLMVTLTYGFGVALAAFAGVLAAPVIQISPLMGQSMIITVFAVVVIGGMGSILGSIVTGLGLGVIEGLTKVFYPQASATVVFVIMVLVLLVRPAGLFGKEK